MNESMNRQTTCTCIQLARQELVATGTTSGLLFNYHFFEWPSSILMRYLPLHQFFFRARSSMYSLFQERKLVIGSPGQYHALITLLLRFIKYTPTRHMHTNDMTSWHPFNHPSSTSLDLINIHKWCSVNPQTLLPTLMSTILCWANYQASLDDTWSSTTLRCCTSHSNSCTPTKVNYTRKLHSYRPWQESMVLQGQRCVEIKYIVPEGGSFIVRTKVWSLAVRCI